MGVAFSWCFVPADVSLASRGTSVGGTQPLLTIDHGGSCQLLGFRCLAQTMSVLRLNCSFVASIIGVLITRVLLSLFLFDLVLHHPSDCRLPASTRQERRTVVRLIERRAGRTVHTFFSSVFLADDHMDVVTTYCSLGTIVTTAETIIRREDWVLTHFTMKSSCVLFAKFTVNLCSREQQQSSRASSGEILFYYCCSLHGTFCSRDVGGKAVNFCGFMYLLP